MQRKHHPLQQAVGSGGALLTCASYTGKWYN
jgi:hypothetical protein